MKLHNEYRSEIKPRISVVSNGKKREALFKNRLRQKEGFYKIDGNNYKGNMKKYNFLKNEMQGRSSYKRSNDNKSGIFKRRKTLERNFRTKYSKKYRS